jgi:hypothetical protein
MRTLSVVLVSIPVFILLQSVTINNERLKQLLDCRIYIRNKTGSVRIT